MTDEQTPQVDAATLQRIARRVGIFHTRMKDAERDYEGVQAAAWEAFAQIRRRGVPQQEISLPDGTKVALISIDKGGTVTTVNEDDLLVLAAINDAGDIESYIDPAALIDPRVLDIIRQHIPVYVKQRITRAAREAYDKEIAENTGRVINRVTGERETVATVTQLEATGKYSVRWTGKGQILLHEAVDAGLIGLDGDVTAPPQDEASSQEDASAAPAAQVDSAPTVADAEHASAESITPPTGSPAPQRAALFDVPGDDVKARIDRIVDGGRAPKHRPTGEQEAIIDAIRDTTDDIAVEAGAGTGKTSTLQMAAREYKARGLYLVFGRANAAEAKRKFPRHVTAKTTSSIAYAAVGHKYSDRLDHSGQVPALQVAKILRINNPIRVTPERLLAPQQQARLVNAMVRNYLVSADAEPGWQHCPVRRGLNTPEAMAVLRPALLPYARRAWDDLQKPDGQLKFTHDAYVKMWQLTDPQFAADFVLLDEAQDTDPVIQAVFLGQRSCRRIVVGDSEQAIHEWRGAVNALANFPGTRLRLTQSFRFGSAIAKEANKWLTVLGSDMQLTGFHRITSAITPLPQAAAILCRGNSTALAQAMQLLDEGRRTAIVGGGSDIRKMAEAAISLKQGQGCAHPELAAFQTWAQVQDHVENDPAGQDLKIFVKLIDEHGPEGIIACVDRLADEHDCDTAVSTAHKAKGLEWDSVRIADDFHPPESDDDTVPADVARLAYVAVTRARLSLDRSGLAWVDRYLPDGGEQK